MNTYTAKYRGTIDDVQQTLIDVPEVRADELRIRVMGSAINPADLKVVTWTQGAGFIHSSKRPIRPGFDFSGVIEEKGERVSLFDIGDAVYGFLPYSSRTVQGSFANYVVVKASSVAKKPASIDHATAATIPTTGATAYQALVRIAGIGKGSTVLINGASGGVGCFAIQIARLYESEVWGTASEQNLAFVKSLGADHAIDYTKQDVTRLDQQFDIIFDVVSNSSFKKMKKIMRKGGVYITLLPDLGFVRDKIASLFSSKKCKMIVVKSKTQTLAALADMVDQQKIAVPVEKIYPHAQIREALKAFDRGGARGKIGIDFS